MVVDNIKDDFEPGGVQGSDHFLEFAHLLATGAAGGIMRVGREEPQCVVAPVVGESQLQQMRFVDEMVRGQEFYGGDTEG